MKSVLISIQPCWCEMIASGKKTLEVRKTRPNLETPFKVYVYCTKAPKGWFWFDSPNIRRDGAVIGEFVCSSIECFDVPYPAFQNELEKRIIDESCCTYYQLHRYAYHDALYGWHISNLQLYSNPLELKSFRRVCRNDLYCESCAMYWENNGTCGNGALHLTRAPQSWCYVEEVNNGKDG